MLMGMVEVEGFGHYRLVPFKVAGRVSRTQVDLSQNGNILKLHDSSNMVVAVAGTMAAAVPIIEVVVAVVRARGRRCE